MARDGVILYSEDTLLSVVGVVVTFVVIGGDNFGVASRVGCTGTGYTGVFGCISGAFSTSVSGVSYSTQNAERWPGKGY